jgi:hypothetical protein
MAPRLEESFDFSLSLGTDIETATALAEIPSRRGLILFANAENRPIQMLMCADLRRSARARLLTRPDLPVRKADIAAVCTRVYYSPIDAEFACQIAYNRLCRTLFADSFEGFVSLPKLYFVRVEKRPKLAFFNVSEKYEIHDLCFGPFVSRKNANFFAEILNASFDLCRNPECLSAGRFESCPYYQMKTCLGPCLNSSQMAGYTQNLEDAIDAASGNCRQVINRKQNQMRLASLNLEFEKARHIRDQIEQLNNLDKPDFQYIHPLPRFCMLHIDRLKSSRKKPKWVAFILRAFAFTEIHFEAATVDMVINALAQEPCQTTPPEQDYFPTVGLFLHRSRRPGLWMDCSKSDPAFRESLLGWLQASSADSQPAQ